MNEKLQEVQVRIAEALDRSGRPAGSARLLAVSKHQPFSALMGAFSSGQRLFAESYAQELIGRFEELKRHPEYCQPGLEMQFDFVGHLQSNKVKYVVGVCRLIHSIDRFSIAEAVNRQAERFGIIQPVLMQVNISAEDTKFGVPLDDAARLMEEMLRLPALQVEGLMSFGRYVPPDAHEEMRIQEFVGMCELRDKLSGDFNVPLSELSMGVSHDFELAAQHGATIVRVGAGIFGPR